MSSLASVVLLAASAHAGDVLVQATGTVFSATQTSGPFAGVTVGSTAHIAFEVFVPGTPRSSGLVEHAIDVPTLVLQIGAGSASCTGGAPTILLQARPPGFSDGLRHLGASITGGSSVDFDFTTLDDIFGSIDLTQDYGTWSPTLWTTYEWTVLNGGNSIDITPITISVQPASTGTLFCFGDGSGTACPCGNASAAGEEAGCMHSLGSSGRLAASGIASLSGDTLVLRGEHMTDGTASYFQGTTRQSAGAGSVFGDGLRCAGGSVVRLRTVANVAGASHFPAAGDPTISVRGMVGSPGTRTYQVWFRNAASFCTPATFNLTNGVEIVWSS